MAFPAGPLPVASIVEQAAAAQTPQKSKALAAATAIDLTDPLQGMAPCATEYYVTTAGNFVAALAGDSAGTVTQTYPVTVGQVLRGVFVQVLATTTSAGILRR